MKIKQKNGILVLILIVLIHTIRNYIILSKLSDEVSVYKNSNNYNAKFVSTFDNGNIVTMDYYKKDNKQAMFNNDNLDTWIINKDTRKQVNERAIKVSSYLIATCF